VQERWSKVWKNKSLDKEIRDDRSSRKKDRGKLSKKRKPSLDALEHRMMKKERQDGKVRKK
jgi:hypothetical protein